MKYKLLLMIMMLMTTFVLAQTDTIPLVTLQQINYIPDSLNPSTWPNSPLVGQKVRVQGHVTVRPIVSSEGNRNPVLYFGTSWGCYIQDAGGAEWSGLNIYSGDSSGTGVAATLIDLVDTAKTYEFTGTVTAYGQTTELVLTPGVEINLISEEAKRVDPIRLTMSDFTKEDGSFNYDLRKYLGMYVELAADDNNPLIVSDIISGTGSTAGGFKVNNLSGQSVLMYAHSRYFKTGGGKYSERPGYTPPPAGSYLTYIKGLLEVYQNQWEIVPVYPDDLGPVLVSPPVVSSIKRDVAVVGLNTPVTVSATVKGQTGGVVTSVKLFIEVNGVPDSLDMTAVSGDTLYTVTIPGASDSSLINYYVKAYDDRGLSITNPLTISNNRYFYLAMNRDLKISDIHYSPFGSGYSGYNNYQVSGIKGVVIADTSDMPGSINRGGSNPARVYIQDGNAPWSGIILGTLGEKGLDVYKLKRGDLVSVSGTVMMSSYGTKIDTLTSLDVISSDNELPEPVVLDPGVVGTSRLGTLTVEPYNGMLVTYKNVVIDSLNADGSSNFGESYVNNGTLPHTRLIWSDGNTHYHNGWNVSYAGDPNYISLEKGDKFQEVTGVLGYTHSYYKLAPRKDDDVVGFNVGVEDNNMLPGSYSLSQNYPNPFNPSTIIEYAIPSEGMVTVKVFNLLGQEIKTLVNEVKPAGSYKVRFDAGSLTSGIYFYSISSGEFSQVKKMIFMK